MKPNKRQMASWVLTTLCEMDGQKLRHPCDSDDVPQMSETTCQNSRLTKKKIAISLMAPDRRNRRCDHVLARIPHYDAGVFEKVAQGSVADEPEAARCELRATTEQSVFAILWQHMEISLAYKDSRAGFTSNLRKWHRGGTTKH